MPKIVLVLFFLIGSIVLGHSQTIQQKDGKYKQKKHKKVADHHQKMLKKKQQHSKNWTQYNKTKSRTFLKKKKKKQ